MKNRTSFQCPDTGQTVIAHYAFGRVMLRAASDDGEEILPDTLAYCKQHTNKRCRSFDEADDYIVRVSDGQSFGFERE